ncbi:MAG: AI-2E family transporter, partial [bacterium]
LKTQEPGPAKWEFSRQISETFGQFRDQLQENIVELLRLSRTYLVAVVSSFFTTFLVLMISAFILIDPARLPNFVRSLVPERFHPNFQDLLVRLDHGLSGVVRGQVMICLLNGALTGVGIAIIGVPFVITLSLIATLFSLIPIFGVLISTIPIMLIALTVSFSTAVLALGWILIIHFLEGNFLNPKILGDASHIHPVLIVFALVAGQYLGGIMGALLAVPVFSLIQSSFLFLKGLAERAEAAS